MPRFLLTLAALGLSTIAHALPQHTPVPGGVVLQPLGETAQAPHAALGERPVAVVRQGKGWTALVGVPLDTPAPGQIDLTVTPASGSPRTLTVAIQPKDYPVQRLTVKNQNQVTPDAESLARIEREKAVTDQLKRQFNPGQPLSDFQLPANGPLSSRFGLRRFFNGEPRNPHAGLDVAVGTGAPVHAPAPGTVLDTGEYFFNGNTVFLDHGQGLISAYMHLSRVDVSVGQTLKAGDTLGAVGSTGRVTGPHLHWAVFLNGTAVDPALFLPPQKTAATPSAAKKR